MNRIILTGASSGLGKALAQVFHDQWYEVVGLCRSKPAEFVRWIETDLSDMTSIEKSVQNINEDFPCFNVLINCAGVLQVGSVEKIDTIKTTELFQINTTAPVILTSLLFPQILKNEADIINIGSNIIQKQKKWFLPYATSKWALKWFSEGLRVELQGTKSRVIGFNPGWMSTPIFDNAWVERDVSSEDMDPDYIAKFVFQIASLPKNMEVSEVIINRK